MGLGILIPNPTNHLGLEYISITNILKLECWFVLAAMTIVPIHNVFLTLYDIARCIDAKYM